MSSEVPGFVVIKGESLYSILTRHYFLSGHYNHAEYLHKLFGSHKVRIHPYLPTGLDAISKKLDFNNEKLLYRHTLFPLFTLNLEHPDTLRDAMFSFGASAVMAAHLPQFKLPFFSGHKYCPLCVARDLEQVGCGIWYIWHQVPGVVACATHSCRLEGVSNQDGAIDRQLMLPTITRQTPTASEADVALSRYASLLIPLLASPDLLKCDPIGLYRRELCQRRLASSCGRLYLQKIINSIDRYWHGLDYDSYIGIPNTMSSWSFIGPLLRRKTGYPTHAIKHLLFSGWLFQCDPISFVEALKNYRSYNESELGETNQKMEHGDCDNGHEANERLTAALSELNRARLGHPEWLRQDIKEAHASAYFYIYNHARNLLDKVLPPKLKPNPSGKGWAEEDLRLEKLISSLDNVGDMSLSEIDRKVTGRGFLRKSLVKLPRTACLLKKLGKI